MMNICDNCEFKEQSDGELVCETCGNSSGYVLVEQYRPNSFKQDLDFTRYKPSEYVKKTFKYLITPPIPLEFGMRKLHEYLKTIDYAITWCDLMKWCKKELELSGRDMYSLPTMLGLDYVWNDVWLKKLAYCKTVWVGKSKLNNAYGLYQIIRLSGDSAEWFPLYFSRQKLKLMNDGWEILCKKIGWKYSEVKCKENVKFKGLSESNLQEILEPSKHEDEIIITDIEQIREWEEERMRWIERRCGGRRMVPSCI